METQIEWLVERWDNTSLHDLNNLEWIGAELDGAISAYDELARAIQKMELRSRLSMVYPPVKKGEPHPFISDKR